MLFRCLLHASDCTLRGHLRGTLAFENREGLRMFRIGPETKMYEPVNEKSARLPGALALLALDSEELR